MKRIVELVEDLHKKTGGQVCIGVDVWVHDSGNRETEWNTWNGEKLMKFKSFQDLTDYLALIEEV